MRQQHQAQESERRYQAGLAACAFGSVAILYIQACLSSQARHFPGVPLVNPYV